MKLTQIVFIFCLCFPSAIFAENTVEQEIARTIDVTLRIDSRIFPANKGESPKVDPILNRANLIAIKQFILKQGKTETYCNMYNNNPAYSVGKSRFYLNPDTGQRNINCDPKLSDFHTLVIRNMDWGYRHIAFKEEHVIFIRVSWPQDELNVKTVRGRAEEALKAILEEMKRIEKEQGNENEASW